MNHLKIAFSIIFLFSFFAASAQKVMMEEKPDVSSNSKFGPNQDYYLQWTLSAGALIGSGDTRLPVNDLRSTDFSTGFKFKRKINGLLSFWIEPKYHYASYNINQVDNKTIADSLFWGPIKTKHVKERFSTESFMLNGFFRINFDPKRGNYIGTYLDLGAGLDFILDKEYVAIDNEPNGSELRTSYSKLPYMNSLNYNGFARLGFDWWAVGFNYRLSGIFKSQYGLPEPPAYTISIEINPSGH
jgi:hypothetical protein